MDYRLLGPLEVVDDAGRLVPVGTGRQRALLTLLLLRANELVASERLVEALWGASPPATANKMLHNQVAMLRRSLGRNGRLETQGSGYRLNVAAGERDVDRFEELVARGRARMRTDLHGAATAFRQALRLWRGPALSDVAYESFAQTEIAALQERRWAAFEARVEAELALGLHADLIAELETAVVEEPLRERLHAQLLLALYRCGRQADALEAYTVARRGLVEQIGVEPGPELRALHASILSQDPALDRVAMREELPAALAGGSPLLAGRSRELAMLGERLADACEGRGGTVLVCGPAGIGKTRLAAELAREALRRGVAIFHVGARGPPGEALAAVRDAQALDRPALVIVDAADAHSEDVLAGAAALAAGAPGLLLLVLHRGPAPPNLPGSRLELGALGIEAVAEIARLYRPGGADGPALDALAIQSEGVPLAVHRAAARWARAQADGQLVGSAGRTAAERGELRRAERDLAGDVSERQAASERARLYTPDADGGTPEPAICPFLGLATFDANHARYFFGRERLVAELVARLVGASLLAVVGPSGSGKSSAVRAGLLPALAGGVLPGSAGWRQAVMRPGARPLDALERALDELGPDRRSVLVVDQFEEAFTACRDEDRRAAFLDALVDLAGDRDQRVLVVLAMRADFYGRCAAHDALARLVGANQVLVGAMRADELRRAIELPAAGVGLRVEPSLTDALVADVRDEPGGLPLLSAALLELWRERHGAVMQRAAYDRSGGVRGAVGRLAEETYAQLDAPMRHAARRLLMRLADAGEQETAFVRRQVPLAEFEPERDEPTGAALAALTDSRLVTVDAETVEVAHEALLREWPRLRSWLEEDADGRRLHQHLMHAARDWQSGDRDPGELYRGARLASALEWTADHEQELNGLEREFLAASRAEAQSDAERQRHANRRLRTLLAGLAGLLALAVAAGVVAVSQRGEARDAATAADAQRLGAEALIDDALDHALLLARAGVALHDSAATRSSLLSVLQRSPAAIGQLPGTAGGAEWAVAVSPDERLVAVGGERGTVGIYDAAGRRPLGEPYRLRDGGGIQALQFSPDGSTLAVAGFDGEGGPSGELVDLIDSRTLKRTRRVRLPRYPGDPQATVALAMVFMPGGHDLVVGQTHNDSLGAPGSTLHRIDVRAGAVVGRPVRVGDHAARALTATADGKRLFVTVHDEDATYEIDAERLRVLRRHDAGDVLGAVSPDGRVFALGSENGGVRLLDLRSGRLRPFTGGHDGAVDNMAFAPDGRTLVTSGADGNVIVWDVERGEIRESLSGHGRGHVWALALSPDGRTAYTAGDDARAIVWDLVGDRRLVTPLPAGRPFVTDDDDDEYPVEMGLSPDDRTLAVAQDDGTVQLVDTRTLARLGRLRALPGFAAAVEYSPDGRLLAVTGEGGRMTLWDARTRRPAGELTGMTTTSQAVAFSPDSTLLAAAELGSNRRGSDDGSVRIWDVRSRAPTGVRFHLWSPSLAFSPDGRLLAAADLNGGIEIRDARNGTLVRRVRTADRARSVAFSPDGRLLATGDLGGEGQLWSTETWEPFGSPLVRHDGRLLTLSFSADSGVLASTSADGTVALWDVETQKELGSPLMVDPNKFISAVFTHKRSQLFVASALGRRLRWDVSPEAWKRHACRVAGRELTAQEWADALPNRPYRATCPPG